MDAANRFTAILAQRALARRRLIEFIKLQYDGYEAGWVQHDICERLEQFLRDVKARKSPRLMLNCPPRLGKSLLASIMFPAWAMGQDPKTTIISTSYNLDLPLMFSRKVRGLVRDDEVYRALFPETVLSTDSQSAETWETTEGGVFVAAGIGGGLTGKGCNLLIIDDNIKNSDEADNMGLHDKQYEWYMSTAYTRLAPGGGVIVIATRWNYSDLSGRLQNLHLTDPDADKFEVVSYPAIADTYEYRHRITRHMNYLTDPSSDPDLELMREPGEVLHPERFTDKMVNKIKANLSKRIWSALYQQKPTPDEGIFFRKEYIRYLADVPYLASANLYTTWDFAISTKASADYTASSTVVQDSSGMLIVADITRFKRDTYGIVEAIIDEAKRCMDTYPAYNYMVGVEDGQIFKTLAPVLSRRMNERKVYFSYEALPPLTDKLVRARPLQSLMQQGKVYFVNTIPVLPDTTSELLQFPASRNDDMVDSLSWAARMALKYEPPNNADALKSTTTKSWKDTLSSLTSKLTGNHFMGD